MTTTQSASLDRARFERACEWFVELREKPESQEVVAEWLAWCRADPLNREAFERASEVWQATGEATPVDLALALKPVLSPSLALSAIDEMGGAGDRSVSKSVAGGSARTNRIRTTRQFWSIAGGALAASAGIVALFTFWVPRLNSNAPTTSILTSSAGENRATRLSDGSTVVLGAQSQIRSTFDGRLRQLTLERGEAYFQVAHDAARPFIVTAGDLRVRAVGTAFNVRTGSDRVVVAVAEGAVSIEPHAADIAYRPPDGGSRSVPRARTPVLRGTLRAVAGEEVAVDIADEQLHVVRIEPTAVASWQRGRLQFAREPLRAVIASVNRYSSRRIVLEDPALGELRFTGTVFADRIDDWIRGLPAIFPVDVRDEGAGATVVPRTQTDTKRASSN